MLVGGSLRWGLNCKQWPVVETPVLEEAGARSLPNWDWSLLAELGQGGTWHVLGQGEEIAHFIA